VGRHALAVRLLIPFVAQPRSDRQPDASFLGVPSRAQSPTPASDDLDHLIDTLDHESAVEALAYLQSLRRPRLLSEAGIDDEPGTEEDQAAAVEAWQLDRRHALDER
jgi:hypothetical protein